MSSLAETLVSESEGCRLTAYKDSLGKWTVGYGHLLSQDQDWTGYAITQEQADQWLSEDMGFARNLATGFPHYVELNEVRQACLVSMCFQLGNKPLHWPHFIAALEARDYDAASAAGLDSLWAKETPKRASREMVMLSTGEWVAHG
jgi:lysozyme